MEKSPTSKITLIEESSDNKSNILPTKTSDPWYVEEKNNDRTTILRGITNGTEMIQYDETRIKESKNRSEAIVLVGNELGTRKEDIDFRITTDTIDRAYASRKKSSTYASKKRLAQGMIDIALLTSNASQLRNLIESHSDSKSYAIVLVLILVSIFLQVGVGVGLILKGHYNYKAKLRPGYIARINNSVLASVFMITIVNIFIAAFGPMASLVRDPAPRPAINASS